MLAQNGEGVSDEAREGRVNEPVPFPEAGWRAAFVACTALLVGLTSGCASFSSEVHLAPFYTRIATGDGRVETEALGGLYEQRSVAADGEDEGRFESLTIGPLVSVDENEVGDLHVRYLVPLGYTSARGDQVTSVLFPFYVWVRERMPDGHLEWRLAALPGLLARGHEVEGMEIGWFPIIGRFDELLTFDHIFFFLWPLFIRAERDERVSYHFLYPVLGWTTGGGERSFRFWPFFGRSRLEGRYDRRFLLWPLFHLHDDNLGGGGEEPGRTWMAWPFFGRTKRGSYRATTVLWPFFGWASDPRDGFWALDAPFFFVRIQRGPGDVERTRFWPFWSHFEGDGLESTTVLWPIVHERSETNGSWQRDSFHVVPFWQSWDTLDAETGESASWRKLFPVFQHERRRDRSKGSFPTLDPFWRNELVDRHLAWAWKAWEWERSGAVRRERSWLGLWRRERDAGEDRRSFAGLWAQRRYRTGGRSVVERSLLFGLLRWRVTEDEGFDMLRAAFPGPGWPLERVAPPGAAAEP